jgi:uracil-DNA glycosylase
MQDVRHCVLCQKDLPLGARPVLQMHPDARILLAGQAPGRKVHESGIAFSDASGERLRDWMGINAKLFYQPQRVAILPMGFCYPGTGKSGDIAPRPECACLWRASLLAELKNIQLTLVIGRYAQAYHLPNTGRTVTETVLRWREYGPSVLPLPHPSPRNNRWLRKNLWFSTELLPVLKIKISQIFSD